MKEIPLSKGLFAKIDDIYAPEIQVHKWYAGIKGKYAMRDIKKGGLRTKIYMHRAIMSMHLGYEITEGREIDHIDGDGLNNQVLNLRLCNRRENSWNKKKVPGVEFIGVQFIKRYAHNPYIARITLYGESISLGNFPTAEEAAYHRDLGAIKYRGEFARLNFEERRGEYINKIRGGFDPRYIPKFTSKFRGVSKHRDKWRSTICYNGEHIYLGIFNTEEEAANAWTEAFRKLKDKTETKKDYGVWH